MLNKFLLLLFLVSFTSCFENTFQATKNVSLYYRNIGGNNGYTTYMDMVVLINYHNKSKTFRQLYEIAKHYIDTVKADRPVSSITLIGQKPGGYLPKADAEYHEDQKRYMIISFGFDNAFKDNNNKKIVELNDIYLYENSVPHPYPLTISPPELLDSFMNSTTPLDTGF